jgi:UDP-N-acetylglucosamine 3-dehydrogenase
VRVGILQYAHVHAPQYADVLASLEGVEFVGVADDVTDRGQEAAGRYGIRHFAEPEALFEAADAVIVCSENARHAGDVIPTLQSGVHVLCEKPIATTVEDAGAMIEASTRTGTQLRVAFPVRYLPAVAQAGELIRSGAVGRVLAVAATNHGTMPDGWFLDPELSGGGAVMDHTVHVADMLRWVLDVEAKSVYAEVGTRFGAGEVDDAGILTLELEGASRGTPAHGAFATIDPSWSRGAGYPTWGDVTMRVAGTSGVLEVDAFAQRLTYFDHGAGRMDWRPIGEDMNRAMISGFLAGVAAGQPEGASGLDGLRALEVVLAAYDSAERHEVVPVVRFDP